MANICSEGDPFEEDRHLVRKTVLRDIFDLRKGGEKVVLGWMTTVRCIKVRISV